jgi:superfamily II DNA or RNA helicase
MARLEELTAGAVVKGILPEAMVTVVSASWHGQVLQIVYRDSAGRLGEELLYRDREPTLDIAESGRPWSFDGDGPLFRLVSEAHRIHLAYLFDPVLAVHTSLVEALPHQITAVYGEMLTRQPLRFLLADDPGAGKTIMAGLLIKELLVRGDLKRCMVVCPGSLAEQWQQELYDRFRLTFDILTNDKLESAGSGNWFFENPLAICRLDKLSRDEALQAKLAITDWDLIICDEAHKMSASYSGGEVRYTRRYHLGQLLGGIARHFLLMTATPHNGKEEDFQLFMALLEADRFEGRFRETVHTSDASDLMRRLVKEQLVKFDGTPLFPERIAYTVNYTLSDLEARLYAQVTDYVRQEFNRADQLGSDGRVRTVGFALTVLQRRLASSPEAIYQSLRRRRERLEARLREAELLRRGDLLDLAATPVLSEDDFEDLEDAPDAEVEAAEANVIDQATAARTIAELQLEIKRLQELEALGLAVRHSGRDRKWEELCDLLQNNAEMFDVHGSRRKLVIFTEHRDTLNYLAEKIRALFGRPEAVVAIHGGLPRDERRKAQESFSQDREVQVLVATDAAGEGINLQRAHLMVNYDLPWNPNRLEQRFGRIHRIGQTEVCHLWNLVAAETREGEVFSALLHKIEEERAALGGQVFDVLGKVTFDNEPLRKLLVEAIRYGDRPEVRARLQQVVNTSLDTPHLQELLEERALVRDSLDASRVRRIREDMERAEARRLQPHFIASFFLKAFAQLGGSARERESRRYELTHVPAAIRNRDRLIGVGEAVLPRYERITFEKDLISVPGKPLAEFVCPGHPLLDAAIDLILERHRDLLKRGAVLIDPADAGQEPRVLFYLEHAIQDARLNPAGSRRVVSNRLQFVEMDESGGVRAAGYAPYLDYEPLEERDRPLVESKALLDAAWLRDGLEDRAMSYAIEHLVPDHLREVSGRKSELVRRTKEAVHERLTKEVNYWDHRARQLKEQEDAGKTSSLNSARARQRAEELEARLQKRMDELEQELRLSAQPPVAIGGALVLPAGLIARLRGNSPPDDAAARETARIERLAMDAVLAFETTQGFEPRDVSAGKLGYDVESRIPDAGRLRFIEVKGRVSTAATVCVTKNEILTALNKPDDFFLALVLVDGDTVAEPLYLQRPFRHEPDFAVTSVNYDIQKLVSGREANLALRQGAA